MFVLQLPRDRPGAPRLNIGNGCIDAIVGRVRFGGGGHQHNGIRQRQTGLRQTDSVGNIDRSLYDGDDLRPRQTNILTGADHQAAAGAGQVPCLKQAAQIVQCSVRVRAAHGFLIGGNDVIVVIAQLVIPHGGAGGHLLDHVKRDGAAAVFDGGCCDGKFQIADCLAHVTASALGQIVKGIFRNENRRLIFSAQPCGSAAQTGTNIVGGQRLEFKHRAAGQQGVIYIKVGILGGGGNQGDGTLLHTFQKALLLALVKILYLVKI